MASITTHAAFALVTLKMKNSPKMTTYTTSDTDADLRGILALQKSNLPQCLTAEEIRSQGFVTVNHTFQQLKRLNDCERHIIAKNQGKVIGYVLAMTQESRHDIPILVPMFKVFDTVVYDGKIISGYHFIIVGQVCVDKSYRGQGVFSSCYTSYRQHYQSTYDFAITEIATTNLRSLAAHKKVGFKEIYSYRDANGTEWAVVLWDWK